MVTKKDIQIEIALRMWKAIADDPFCNLTEKKKEFAKQHYVKWLNNCFLCEFYMNKDCVQCPLCDEYGSCGNDSNPYDKLIQLYKKNKKMVEKWKKNCNEIIVIIEQLKGNKND